MKPTIALIDDDPDRAAAIRAALQADGREEVVIVPAGPGLAKRIAAIDPQVVLIDAASPSRDQLEELTLASGPMERAVAVFVPHTDAATTRRMIEAGVAAYVVNGLRPDRVRTIVDTATARFNILREMRAELSATRAALEDRKVIDRAKGIIMRARGIDEDAAYALLRRSAMENSRKIAEIARSIVTAAELLK